MIELLKILPNKPFKTNEAKKLGISNYYLSRLIEAGEIERISRGLYQVSNILEEEYTDLEKSYIAATLTCSKPSAICLLSALEYYNLVDEIPSYIWVLVPANKRVRSEEVKVFRSRNPLWQVGISHEKDYSITTIERTIIDSILNKKIIGQNIALSALKKAITERKTNVDKLFKMSSKMNVYNRIKNYLDMLSV